jgi:peptidoglycan/xylan/chitin deacetylase (PgdA/CDA1 family)/ubiquinone/menaquinone biosynthesis C-methylase UbiE
MICPLSLAHFFALGAFQLYALLLVIFPPLAPVPLVIFVLVCLTAPLFPEFSYYLPIITKGTPGSKGVALTFDDGPDPEVTPRLLELLARHSAPATFFVTGANAEKHPDLIRSILHHGHSVGNHSFSHDPFLMFKRRKTLRMEIESTQTALKEFGIVPLAFRPPAGVTNPHLWRVLLELGMYCVNFSCRVGDMGNRRIQNLAARVLAKVRPRDIVMLHDVTPSNGKVDDLLREFDLILAGLKARNLDIQPLGQLIGKEVMQVDRSATALHAAELFYDGLAATYDQEQFCSGVSISRRRELKLFTARLPEIFAGADRVLEIGAGTGIFTTTIARHCREVEALDISTKMLALLEEKCRNEGIANVRYRAGNVETIELNGPYDVVCAFSALEYLTDLPALLKRLQPHVRAGGTVYFITARRSLFRLVTQIGNAMRQGMWLKAQSRRKVKAMLTAAGFTPVSIESHLLKCVISGGMLLEVVARKPQEAGTSAAPVPREVG